MRKALLVILAILHVHVAFSGRVEKGFEALKILDYFKAKEYFTKALDKQPAGAGFGLTLVYMQDKSPFYNIDSAYKFLNISDKAFQTVDDKQKEALALLHIDQEQIDRKHVALATKFYAEVSLENTQEAYQYFIDYHPLALEREEAIKLRNHLAFEKAAQAHTMDSYAQFMKDYPESADFGVAKQAFYELEYAKFTQDGNAYSYQVFVKNKPENPFVDQAQLEIYKLYTASGKADDFEKFIVENPDNRKVPEAWDFLYALKTSTGSAAAIAEFIIDFPDYPDPEQLKQDLIAAQTYFIPAQQNGKYGYVDTNGVWLIKPIYEWVSSFSEGKATVGLLGNAVYINKSGKVLFHHMLSDAYAFQNTRAVVEFDDYYGVINFMGDTVIPIEYDEVGEFSEGLIYAGRGDDYGYFNEQGVLVVPFEYDNAYDFNEGKALVSKDGKYGIINVLGQEIIPPAYESLVLDSSVCIAKFNNYFGVITYGGDTVLPFEFDKISTVSNGVFMAAKADKYQYYKINGELAFDRSFVFNEATFNYSGFHNGYARVVINNKVGIIDLAGKKVYPAIFSDVGRYSSGLTAVNKTGSWGYANAKVKLEIPYAYKFANNFVDSLAIVQADTAWGVINLQNQFVLPPVFTSITPMDSLWLVEQHGLFGVLNAQNDTLLPIAYQKIEWSADKQLTLINAVQDNKQHTFWLERQKWVYKEE